MPGDTWWRRTKRVRDFRNASGVRSRVERVDQVLASTTFTLRLRIACWDCASCRPRECADAVCGTAQSAARADGADHIVPLQHAGVCNFVGVRAEVRSVDTLAGSPLEINESTLPKVGHVFRRGEQNLYVVNGAVHFGLRPSPASLILLLRRSRTALLIDGIEKMTTMTRLQALPAAFCNEERVVVSRIDGLLGSERDSRGQSRGISYDRRTFSSRRAWSAEWACRSLRQ